MGMERRICPPTGRPPPSPPDADTTLPARGCSSAFALRPAGHRPPRPTPAPPSQSNAGVAPAPPRSTPPLLPVRHRPRPTPRSLVLVRRRRCSSPTGRRCSFFSPRRRLTPRRAASAAAPPSPRQDAAVLLLDVHGDAAKLLDDVEHLIDAEQPRPRPAPPCSSPPDANVARPQQAASRPPPAPPSSSPPVAGLPRVGARGGEDGSNSAARVCSSPSPPKWTVRKKN
ncbi:Os12g0255701 [Oryza sativa Japonica Group]|uniref:Os12g0255701 protein n=2 Tax=Oryza sativa subsp. japonica TaxID=39947 RepID=C7J9X0_ORYSJ|nr:Os12g0255701 [Oryza sativa Japonica Group]BAT16558.1 Os12g0255701 [Oryza sativa Japonica Group]|eukprot:NP_001176876.1 Os12g0255701 [Oryza sativa Japonica Group]